MVLSCFTDPIEIIAAQLVLLQTSRPSFLAEPLNFINHQQEENLLYEELVLRSDSYDHAHELIEQARATLELLTPGR